jgi:hypothetical protein
MTDSLQAINAYKFTPEVQRLAIKVYSETNSRVKAAKAAGVHLATLERHLQRDPTFRECMLQAKAVYVAKLEEEAYRRAVTGVTQSKPGPGGVWYDVTTYDTALLLHLLKKADPARHGDTKTVEVKHTKSTAIDLEQLSPEKRELLRQLLESELKSTPVIEVTVEKEVDSDEENS